MVPKLHAKGCSFRGAAAYLLHDKDRARTSERVAWTETRNIATDDPDHAWRIMAATALDQARLKQQAGIKSTGRKSNDAVLHMTLSWHPDEKTGLSREEMMKAALGAVRALRAEDRQVLFVSHDDEPQPHVHVLINRVSPADGRMLPSSKEKLALSHWAESYERERGQILCEERVTNNAARKRGEFVRGEADTPRHIFELEEAHAHKPGIEAVKKQQRASDRALARQRRNRSNRRAKAWNDLLKRQSDRLSDIRHQNKRNTERAKEGVRSRFRPEWSALLRRQEEQVRAFETNEERFMGRMKNVLSAIDFRAIVRAGDRKQALGEAFDAIASKGARLEALKRVQEKSQRALLARQRAEEKRIVTQLRDERNEKLATQRAAFINERMSLVLVHDMEDAAHRHEWRRRSESRRAAYGQHRSGEDESRKLDAEKLREQLKQDHDKRMDNRPDRGQRPRRSW